MGPYQQNNSEFLCERRLRNTQAVKDFIYKWRHARFPSKEVLYDYKPICKNLLYEDEDIVLETKEILVNNITSWSKISKSYSNSKKFFSKQDFQNKEDWYVKEILSESAHMATSGSTTGLPFSYLRWEPFLYFIEGDNHYDLIMDEFNIRKNPEVLYFFNTNKDLGSNFFVSSKDSKNFMEHHGTSRISNVHYVNFDIFISDQELFFEKLVEYLATNEMDVIFAPGPVTNSLCSYLKRNSLKNKLCKLLSNSNERILSEDVLFLFDGYVDNICDHMRCWDGGASFFTCKEKTYHLMDNLSWCIEIDNKLISTDYFSLPSPFVNYWNGDYCSIENQYKRCECGRLYREFEFLENRPFSVKGTCFKQIKDKIESLNFDFIKQVRCGLNTIDVVISEKISSQKEQEISKITDKFDFRFIVE